MKLLGYEHLRAALKLTAFPLDRPARLRPVGRVLATIDALQIPASVAPKSEDPVEHLLFALKYEDLNLQVLAEALPLVSGGALLERLHEAPTGQYIRKACYLWEAFNGQTLTDLPAISGPYVPLFDPNDYITGPVDKNARWRVDWNGIGSLAYCPTVRRTLAVQHGIDSNILGRTNAFIDSLGAANADRALAWAYLSETDSSFAIEREAPGQRKAEAFVKLLQQAHENIPLSEAYLSDLQSATISNPYERAASFRQEQNWLRGGATRGASSVTYVPPAPSLLHQLMPAFLEQANTLPKQIDPLVAAAVSSFGFVFLHPFMDGNGRLSRFLFHHALCQSGQLARGLLLPVSIAMKRHEADYLTALQSFSKPARSLWDVTWIDEDQFTFSFTGADSIYRFYDATPCVEFGFAMAEQALNVDLRHETEFLASFDRISRAVNDAFDVRGEFQHLLIVSALQNGGIVSKNRRKKLAGQVPDAVFDYVEELAKAELDERGAEPSVS